MPWWRVPYLLTFVGGVVRQGHTKVQADDECQAQAKAFARLRRHNAAVQIVADGIEQEGRP